MPKIDLWEILKNSWPGIWKLWPLWVLILVLVAFRLFFDWLDLEIDNWVIRRKFKKGEKWRSDQDLIRWLRGMNPTDFEIYISDLFRRLGYKTEVVGGSHDGGVDVIAEKDGVKHYIQCKKYFGHRQVGSPEVREFYGALADHFGNGEGWFITTNKFTPEAEKFAADKPIVLINQFKLAEYVRLAEKKRFEGKPQKEEGLKCPRCGGELVQRTGKYGKFWGCSNYPKCKYTQAISNPV